jgi:hypothetical protein
MGVREKKQAVKEQILTIHVNHKKVFRLMKEMGIQSVSRKKGF